MTTHKDVVTEHVNITLPVGMSKRAKELGINMSFHAAKAIRNEIDKQEL